MNHLSKPHSKKLPGIEPGGGGTRRDKYRGANQKIQALDKIFNEIAAMES
jgi:hypothetical protein